MSYKHRYILGIPVFLLIMVILSGSCLQSELQRPTSESVRIVFDWKNLSSPSDIPSGMQLCFYGTNNTPVSRYSSSVAYNGALAPDIYQILIYNPNATGIKFRNLDHYENAELYVLPEASKTQSHIEPLTTPYHAYGISLTALHVQAGHSIDTTVKILNYVKTVKLQVELMGYAALVSTCEATISGIATTLNLSTGRPIAGNNACIKSLLSCEDSYHKGIFTLIGNNEQTPSFLTLKLYLTDGSERIIRENISVPMGKINQQTENYPLMLKVLVDVQQIDGVITTDLKNWSYKEE